MMDSVYSSPFAKVQTDTLDKIKKVFDSVAESKGSIPCLLDFNVISDFKGFKSSDHEPCLLSFTGKGKNISDTVDEVKKIISDTVNEVKKKISDTFDDTGKKISDTADECSISEERAAEIASADWKKNMDKIVKKIDGVDEKLNPEKKELSNPELQENAEKRYKAVKELKLSDLHEDYPELKKVTVKLDNANWYGAMACVDAASMILHKAGVLKEPIRSTASGLYDKLKKGEGVKDNKKFNDVSNEACNKDGKLNKEKLKPGDVVFFEKEVKDEKTGKVKKKIHHVGIVVQGKDGKLYVASNNSGTPGKGGFEKSDQMNKSRRYVMIEKEPINDDGSVGKRKDTFKVLRY